MHILLSFYLRHFTSFTSASSLSFSSHLPFTLFVSFPPSLSPLCPPPTVYPPQSFLLLLSSLTLSLPLHLSSLSLCHCLLPFPSPLSVFYFAHNVSFPPPPFQPPFVSYITPLSISLHLLYLSIFLPFIFSTNHLPPLHPSFVPSPFLCPHFSSLPSLSLHPPLGPPPILSFFSSFSFFSHPTTRQMDERLVGDI